jgi:hypothetical protein
MVAEPLVRLHLVVVQKIPAHLPYLLHFLQLIFDDSTPPQFILQPILQNHSQFDSNFLERIHPERLRKSKEFLK